MLHQPKREVELRGPKTVAALLNRLDLVSESVLVIRDDQLLTNEERLQGGGADGERTPMAG